MKKKEVCVIGLGYIGLPTAALIASKGIKVTGIDTNKNVVDTVNNGDIHIVEPNLKEAVANSVKTRFLKASTKPVIADIFIIAVPTPFKVGKNGIPKPDISFIENAIENISPVVKKGDLIILESTSPVGTTEKIIALLGSLRKDLVIGDESAETDIHFAYCPERVLPGQIMDELISNDRVIGGFTKKCSMIAKDFYNSFVSGDCFITNSRTAEMVKLTENSSRDVQIAFANELSVICEEERINVWELIHLANKHPRVNILQPGPGVGGHCIAVDPWFIVDRNPKQAKLIKQARQVNDSKPNWVVNKIISSVEEIVLKSAKLQEEITISLFGLAFKANIDDLRESPALEIADKISKLIKCKINAVEPNIQNFMHDQIKLVDINYAKENSDIVVVLVDHKEFLDICFDSSTIVIDTKGITKKGY